MGLDAAGKTTILYKLKLGEIVTTIPTIGGSWLPSLAAGQTLFSLHTSRKFTLVSTRTATSSGCVQMFRPGASVLSAVGGKTQV